jgi:hypothetical protein
MLFSKDIMDAMACLSCCTAGTTQLLAFHKTIFKGILLPDKYHYHWGLLKDDNFSKFQQGLELFNGNELPASSQSSCLALVAKQGCGAMIKTGN